MFSNSTRTTWWNRPLRSGFEHVLAFKEPQPEQLLFVNPRVTHCEMVTFAGRAHDWIGLYLERGCSVVWMPAAGESWPYVRPSLHLTTCATMLSYVLGLPRVYYTPRGLYRGLLRRHGGELVRETAWAPSLRSSFPP